MSANRVTLPYVQRRKTSQIFQKAYCKNVSGVSANEDQGAGGCTQEAQDGEGRAYASVGALR